MKQAIQLLRVSTEGQAAEDRNGLAAQRAACTRLAGQHGLTVTHTVELVDVSGSAIMATREMQHLIKLLQTDQYHGLVVREFSRVLRPTNYDYYLFGVMAETRCTLYCESGTIEPWTSTGRMMVAMHGVIAANELDTIRTRMMAGKEAMRRAGRWAAGARCLPVGVDYDRASGKFTYNALAQKVQRAFKAFLAGQTNYDALSRLLGSSRGTARNVLTNPIYAGWLVYDRKRDDRRKYRTTRPDGHHTDRPKVARAADEVIRVRVMKEPLISQRDFDRVQQMVHTKASANLKQRQKVGAFTFNGFLWCSKCGARLHTFRNQFNRFYYICSNKKHKNGDGDVLCPHTGYMNRDKLEAQLDALMGKVLGSPAQLQRVACAYKAQLAKNDSRAAVVQAQQELKRLQAKRTRVLENYEDGCMAKAERDDKLKALSGQLRSAEETLVKASPVQPTWNAAQLARLLEPLASWPVLGRTERRQLLTALELRVEVADYAVRGVWLGSPSFDINVGSRWKTVLSASHELPCR
jgi:DNA invertase Pin-like site-specific DNA recombinase